MNCDNPLSKQVLVFVVKYHRITPLQVCRDLAEDKLTIPLIPAEVLSLVKRKYTVTSPNYLLLDLSTEGITPTLHSHYTHITPTLHSHYTHLV